MRRSVWLIFLSLVALVIVPIAYYLFKNNYFKNEFILNSSVDSYQFKEISCWFEVPAGSEVHCGELHTPAATGAFRLPVVRIRDESPDRRADPVIYLQGGPGGSAQLDAEGIEYWMRWMSMADLKRDLILMDPRGVGHSKPALVCEDYDQFSLAALRHNFTQREELEQSYAVVEQCFKDLGRQGFKAENYGTEMSAHDLQALMMLLTAQNPHYQYWNLLGVSYGTRLAIAAARDFPAVRALVLDSTYPAGYGGLQAWPELFDQSMKIFFNWCETNGDCATEGSAPMMDRLLLALRALRRQPVTVHVARWDGEVPVDVMLNDHRFLSVIFSAIYSRHEWVQVEAAIDAAIEGESRGLQALVETFINNAFSDSFYSLAFMAVDCRDHALSSEAEYQHQLKEYPLFAEYLEDLWRYQACQFLTGPEGDGLKSVAPLAQPALLLAGAIDPITPPQWAQALHQQWPSSQLVVLEDTGHAVINSDACIHGNLRKFLDAPREIFDACRR